MMVVFHTPTLRSNPKSIQSNSFPRLSLPPLHPTGSNVQITRSNPESTSPFQISSSHIEPLDSTWNLFGQVSMLLLSLNIWPPPLFSTPLPSLHFDPYFATSPLPLFFHITPHPFFIPLPGQKSGIGIDPAKWQTSSGKLPTNKFHLDLKPLTLQQMVQTVHGVPAQ